MSVIGTFTVPAEAFSLAETLPAVPDVTFESDRLASHSRMQILPFLWARTDDPSPVEDALSADPSVDSVRIADELDDQVLFNVQWAESFKELIDEIVDHNAAIVEATARESRWRLRLRFAEEEMVSEFQQHFRERGHQFSVEQLLQPTVSGQRDFGLTAGQREALVEAANGGYFEVPRTMSAEELGDRLGISANSASERVRRGTQTLVDATLLTESA